MSRRLVIEADGGSRGNPGPAGYGAVVRDAATGEVLAERAASIGTAIQGTGGSSTGRQRALLNQVQQGASRQLLNAAQIAR